MKLILDITSVRYPLTGIGRYTYELGKFLSSSNDLKQILFWKGFQFTDSLTRPDSATMNTPAPKKGQNRIKETLKKNTAVIKLYHNIRLLTQKRRLAKLSDYIFHSPNFYLPPFSGTSIVTVHDLSFIAYPAYHPAARVAVMMETLNSVQKNADFIITISDFSRNEIIRHLNWPEDKIKTTYMAASDIFYPRQTDELTPFLAAHGLNPGSYSLFVGTIEPRKNIEILVSAYEKLPDSIRKHYPLVVCGFRGWENQKLMERIEKAGHEGWLRHLDYLPHNDLPLIMAGARLFLFPSVYEGFGIPPLEAMQSGVPVIVSNATSLPEVVGDAATMIDPHDEQGWREAIEKGLEDTFWREERMQKGLERAQLFSWQRCAEETLAIYKLASKS